MTNFFNFLYNIYHRMLCVILRKKQHYRNIEYKNIKFDNYKTKYTLIDYYFGMNLDKNIKLIALFSLMIGFIVYHLMMYYVPEVDDFKIIWTICRILASAITLMLFLSLPYVNMIMFKIIGQKYIGGNYIGDLLIVNNKEIQSKKNIELVINQSLLKLKLSGVIFEKNKTGDLIKESIFDGTLVDDGDTYSEFLVRFTKSNFMSYGILKLTFKNTDKNILVGYGYLYETSSNLSNVPTQDVSISRLK